MSDGSGADRLAGVTGSGQVGSDRATSSDEANPGVTNFGGAGTGTTNSGRAGTGTTNSGRSAWVGAVASHRSRSSRRARRWRRGLLIGFFLAALLATMPYAWTQVAANGHRYHETDAPSADVVLVLGAMLTDGGTRPHAFLQGRLDTAAQLVESGRAKVILVSGDANGGSGNETAVMSSYLAGVGVDPTRIVVDSAGLDTYDSCLRARQVYGVDRALVVTQSYHLPRAVALCRHLGIDAEGVAARCDDCRWSTLAWSTVREVLAGPKLAWDMGWNRDPGIVTPSSPDVADALAHLSH